MGVDATGRPVGEDAVAPFATTLGVTAFADPLGPVRAVRRWLVAAAMVNYLSTALPLVSSVGHHLFGLPNWGNRWTQDEEPTRVWMFWIFLGFGCLWGTLFLFIRADPFGRRPLLVVGIAEKTVTTVAVWAAFLVFDDIRIALPLIIVVTDLVFVFVFVWARGAIAWAAVAVEAVEPQPVGSSPVARWLLRAVGTVMLLGGVFVAVAAVVTRAGASADCLRNDPAAGLLPRSSCTVVGVPALWVLPGLLVWLWGAMTAVAAGLLLWVAADVVRRRAAIGFGIAAQLIPVVAVILAAFADDDRQHPSASVLWWVVGVGLVAAGTTALAARRAATTALVLGIDLPPPAVAAV